LIANVVHTSLNYRGGAEALAMTTIDALADLGFDIELAVVEKPHREKLESTYGNIAASVLKNISAINILKSFVTSKAQKHDITINTAGDILPYFNTGFTKKNAITYCHFPLATYRIEAKDPVYIEFLKKMHSHTSRIGYYNENANLKLAKATYNKMIRNSTVTTNSEYSRYAIQKVFDINSIVLSPPVNIDIFRNSVLFNSSGNRKNIILVISRLHPSKKVENSIMLAKLLKQNKIKVRTKIIGNLYPTESGYCTYLKDMVRKYNLENYVTIHTNISFTKLLELMKQCKLYLSQCPGEPFGISTVEAMSAGLIPIVPDIGGQTEYVPSKFHFHTFGEAVQTIHSALNADDSERVRLSDSVRKFSINKYIRNLQQIIKKLI
jgi:glycosyltransferase involved in cell wall biosynthesis